MCDSIEKLAAATAHEINTPAQYLADNARFLQDAFQKIGAILEAGAELEQASRTGSLTPELAARAGIAFSSDDLAYYRAQIPAALSDMLDGIAQIAAVVRTLNKLSATDRDKNVAGHSEQQLDPARSHPKNPE